MPYNVNKYIDKDNLIKKGKFMNKRLLTALFLIPTLFGCNPNTSNTNGEYTLKEIREQNSIDNSKPIKILYFQYGPATGTIFNFEEDYYTEVLNKFENVKMKENNDYTPSLDGLFYISVFLTNTNDEGQYIIGVEKTTSFVMIKNNEDYKFYTVSIDEKTYKETREYLNNVPHNLNINN